MYVITVSVNDAMHSILVLIRIIILVQEFFTEFFHLENCKNFAGSAAKSLLDDEVG